MKIHSQLEKGNYGMFVIPISKEDGQQLIQQFGKRVLCQINKETIHCAISKDKDFGYHVMVGKSTLEKIQASHKDELVLVFAKDESKYKAPVPEELMEVLHTDEAAYELFEKLTPGKQRTIIYTVAKAKQPDTRINRALKIAEKLKMGYTDLKEIIR